MKYKKNTLMQASKCKLMHHKAVHKLEHDIIPRDLLTTKTPTPPQTEALPSPWGGNDNLRRSRQMIAPNLEVQYLAVHA